MVYYAARGRNYTFHVESDVSSISRRRVLYTSHETKVQFRPLAAYHIFHNTDTWKVRCVTVNGEASRVRPLEEKNRNKNKFKKFGKKCLKILIFFNFWKHFFFNLRKKFWKKILKTKLLTTKKYNNINKCNTVAVSGARLRRYCASTPPVLRR